MSVFNSSIGRKYIMAASGLFLCLFLVGHLAGNLQLVFGTKDQFNEYAHFMVTNPAVFVLRILTALSIIAHVVMAIKLTNKNKAARPVNYAYNKPEANSTWMSRYMVHMGLVLLAYLAIHLYSFSLKTITGALENYTTAAGDVLPDLYTVTVSAFKSLPYTIFYVVAMLFLAFHLSHGFKSAFQSVGVNHKGYNNYIKHAGTFFSYVVCGLFAFIAIALYIK